MKTIRGKQGEVNIEKVVVSVVGVIILIILVFTLVGNTSSDLTSAADNISGSGLPLASLFSSSGIVLLIFMAGILLAVLFHAMRMHKNQ